MLRCTSFPSHFSASEPETVQWPEISLVNGLCGFLQLGHWLSDCLSVWVNWKWKKQSAFKLEEQRCCDRGEGPLQKILKIFWQRWGPAVWSKGEGGYLWHFTTSVISDAGLEGNFMSPEEGGVKVCVCTLFCEIYLFLFSKVYIPLIGAYQIIQFLI